MARSGCDAEPTGMVPLALSPVLARIRAPRTVDHRRGQRKKVATHVRAPRTVGNVRAFRQAAPRPVIFVGTALRLGATADKPLNPLTFPPRHCCGVVTQSKT